LERYTFQLVQKGFTVQAGPDLEGAALDNDLIDRIEPRKSPGLGQGMEDVILIGRQIDGITGTPFQARGRPSRSEGDPERAGGAGGCRGGTGQSTGVFAKHEDLLDAPAQQGHQDPGP